MRYILLICRTISKMKLFTKTYLVVLIIAILITSVSCSDVGVYIPESTDIIPLKFIVPGKEDLGGNEKVFETFNSYISDKLPGVKVEFEVVNKYNYGETLNMYLNTDKKFDIAWNSDNTQPYLIDINRNHYKLLDNIIQTHGKDILKSFPKDCIENMKIGEHIYYIPTIPYSLNNKCIPFLIIPKEYVKYFDVDAFIYEITTTGFGENTYKIISEYLGLLESNKLLKNGVDYIELSATLPFVHHEKVMSTDRLLGFSHNTPTTVTELQKTKEYNLFETYKKLWIESGYIHKDYIISSKHSLTNDNEYILSSANGFIDENGIHFTLSDDITDDKYFIPLDNTFYPSEYIQNGIVFISTDSRYAEKAMELLNLFYKDNMLYKILTEGLDENKNKVDDYSMYPNIFPTATVNSPQAKIRNTYKIEYKSDTYALSDFVPGTLQLNQLFLKYNNSEHYKEIIFEINEQADSHRTKKRGEIACIK